MNVKCMETNCVLESLNPKKCLVSFPVRRAISALSLGLRLQNWNFTMMNWARVSDWNECWFWMLTVRWFLPDATSPRLWVRNDEFCDLTRFPPDSRFVQDNLHAASAITTTLWGRIGRARPNLCRQSDSDDAKSSSRLWDDRQSARYERLHFMCSYSYEVEGIGYNNCTISVKLSTSISPKIPVILSVTAVLLILGVSFGLAVHFLYFKSNLHQLPDAGVNSLTLVFSRLFTL